MTLHLIAFDDQATRNKMIRPASGETVVSDANLQLGGATFTTTDVVLADTWILSNGEKTGGVDENSGHVFVTGVNGSFNITDINGGTGVITTDGATDPSATLADGDLILIVDPANALNAGLFEVSGATATTITIEPSTANPFTLTSLTTDATTQGTVHEAEVMAFRMNQSTGGMDITGPSQVAATLTTWTSLATGSGNNLEEAYLLDGATGNTITTDGTAGDIIIAGTQKLQITATSGLDVDTIADFDVSSFDVLSSAAFSIDGAAASNVTVTNANLTLSTLTGGDVVVNSVAAVDIDGASATIDTTGAFSIDGAAASNVSVTGNNLTLSSITSGDVLIDSAAELDLNSTGLMDVNAGANLDIDVTGTFDMLSSSTFSIDGTGASNVTATSGNLTLSTLTSGDVVIDSIDNVDIDAGNTTTSANITLDTASPTLTDGASAGLISLTTGNGTADTTGGNGGAINLTTGAGGASDFSGGSGGTGGAIAITTGDGGVPFGTSTGGDGGSIQFTLGNGADRVSSGHGGGDAGDFTITGGTGGISQSSGSAVTAGSGSSITFTAGTGGEADNTGTNNTAGAAGVISLTAGNGGASDPSSVAGADGGAASITAGTGGAHTSTGSGGTGGDVNITAGAGGLAPSGTDGAGGDVNVSAGAGADTAADGSVLLGVANTTLVQFDTPGGVEMTAGSTVQTGRVVYIEVGTTGGRVTHAAASAIGTGEVIGLSASPASVTVGNAVKIASTPGCIVTPVFDSAPTASADEGKVVYLSETAGQVTLTAPSAAGTVVYEIGILLTVGTSTTSTVLYKPNFVVEN